METRKGFLCNDKGLIDFLPEIKLVVPGMASGIHISGKIVSAVIPVDAGYIQFPR